MQVSDAGVELIVLSGTKSLTGATNVKLYARKPGLSTTKTFTVTVGAADRTINTVGLVRAGFWGSFTTADVDFDVDGDWTVQLIANYGGNLLRSVEKPLRIGPALD